MSIQAKIVVILTARPGKVEELVALLRDMVAPSREEAGNRRWDVWKDPSQDGRYVLDELYVDDAAIAAHRETPHFKRYIARIADVAERLSVVVEPLEVAA